MILSPAKINISLSIMGRLNNGFHELSTHILFLDLYDKIFINSASKDSIKIIGPHKCLIESNGGDTLIHKTLSNCRKNNMVNSNYNILLEKNIPISAGLGGGSANSASVIRYFLKYGDNPVNKDMVKFAKLIGSDVPACLYSKPVLVQGIGT